MEAKEHHSGGDETGKALQGVEAAQLFRVMFDRARDAVAGGGGHSREYVSIGVKP
jgi:hypothetical protein